MNHFTLLMITFIYSSTLNLQKEVWIRSFWICRKRCEYSHYKRKTK